ncbi:hypothetical protein DM02DRAFT_610676 [Periconia macrospinosa]|uniref:Uncharacterized protein n=1 Tax=Periconia macrospinosa TaxID=97972 RepID=A0A2V1E7S5_9PLEO|nr:hypothetical protein DM02DRAFT_610676 [Periconia macrospinosa]
MISALLVNTAPPSFILQAFTIFTITCNIHACIDIMRLLSKPSSSLPVILILQYSKQVDRK